MRRLILDVSGIVPHGLDGPTLCISSRAASDGSDAQLQSIAMEIHMLRIRDAKECGTAAADRGESRADNPFDPLLLPFSWCEWDQGFTDRRKETNSAPPCLLPTPFPSKSEGR